MTDNKKQLAEWIAERLSKQDKKEIENLKDFKRRYKKHLQDNKK